MARKKLVLKAIAAHADELRRRKNVVGFGVRRAKGGGALAVYVRRKEPVEALAEADRLPASVEVEEDGGRESVPVAVFEVGGAPVAE